MKHDVFISYRRDGGEHLAGRVKDALKARGFSVFMDVEDLKSGRFDVALFGKIEEATDVIVIFTQGCLDRCKNEDDWFRQEIRQAIKCKRNIVPIIARGFQMPHSETLPADIREMVKYHGLTPAPEMFEASMDRLVSMLLTSSVRPSESIQSHKIPSLEPQPVDVIDGEIEVQLEELADAIVDFDTLPNSRGLVVCYPQETHLMLRWPPSPKDGRIIYEGEEANSCAVSEDGTLLAVGCGSATITIYQLRDRKKVKTLQRPVTEEEYRRAEKLGIGQDSYEYGALAFSPDGRYLAACRRVSSKNTHKLPSAYTPMPMDDSVDVFGLDGSFHFRLPGYGSSPISCFSRDSCYIVVGLEIEGVNGGEEGNNIEVYHLKDGRMAYSLSLDGYPRCIVAHPGGSQAIVSLASNDCRAIRFLSIKSGRENSALSYHAIPDDGRYPCADRVCIDSTGSYLASGHNQGVLRFWDVERRSLLLTWLSNPHGLWVHKLKFCGNGDLLFASFRNYPDLATNDQLAVVRTSDLLTRAAPR
jgi:WD40 repeat protein